MNEGCAISAMIIIFAVLMLAGGWLLGEAYNRDAMLSTYCQSLGYDNDTKLDGLYYCYDSDGLEAVDWMNK
jgi:hypothetical protein